MLLRLNAVERDLAGTDGRAAAPRRHSGPRIRRQRAGDRRAARRLSPDRPRRACRRSTAPRRATNISSSTAGRCATSCWSARCAAPIRISSRATAIRWSRCSSTAAGGSDRRQCPSGQGRGALPRRRPGARPHRRRAAPRARRGRPSRLDHRRRSGARLVPPRRCAIDTASRAVDDPPTYAPHAASPKPPRSIRRRSSSDAFAAPARAAEPSQPAEDADAFPARRGARRSCTRPISSRRPRTASSSSISMRRMSGWSMSA